MATTYQSSIGYDAERKSGSGFFSRVLNRVIEARQQEANRLVRAHLRTYDRKTLSEFGYSDEQIDALFNREIR